MTEVHRSSGSSFDQLDAVREHWNELASRCGLSPDHFWDWQRIVWDQVNSGRELHVEIIADAGGARGIAPLVIEPQRRSGVQIRVLKPLVLFHQLRGTPLIATDVDVLPLLEGSFRSLNAEGVAWHLMFMLFERDSSQAATFEKFLNSGGYRFRTIEAPAAPFMRVQGSWENQMARFDAKFRSEFRTREKKLRARGKIELAFFDSPENYSEGLRHIEVIEAASWKSGGGLPITDPSHWHFYKSYAHVAAVQGRLCLPILLLDGKPIAFDYGVWADRNYYLLQTSYAEVLKEFYPGSVLRKLVVEEMHRRGAREIDFGPGRHIWKSKWTAETREFRTYVVFGRNIKGRYLDAIGWLAGWVRSVRTNRGNPNSEV